MPCRSVRDQSLFPPASRGDAEEQPSAATRLVPLIPPVRLGLLRAESLARLMPFTQEESGMRLVQIEANVLKPCLDLKGDTAFVVAF